MTPSFLASTTEVLKLVHAIAKTGNATVGMGLMD